MLRACLLAWSIVPQVWMEEDLRTCDKCPNEFAFLGVRTEKGMHVEDSGIRKCQTLLVKRQIKNPTLLML